MKFLTSMLFFLFISVLSQAQIVQSSCETNDSVLLAKFKNYAEYMTFVYIHEYDDVTKDSIELSPVYSTQFLETILAVYNATSLPIVDSIFNYHQIEPYYYPLVNTIELGIDEGYWFEELIAENSTTGNVAIDSLFEKYSLSLNSYYGGELLDFYVAEFVSSQNYNTVTLIKEFEFLEGVRNAYVTGIIGDGNDITGSIEDGYTTIKFRKSWGDCPSGCFYSKYWEFKVYDDCTVEYLGVFGDVGVGIESLDKQNISIYPNPFENTITITEDTEYSICDMNGKLVVEGFSKDGKITGLDKLTNQHYILNLMIEGKKISKLVLKN